MRRDVFQAIADPTRREIISLIAHQSLNVNGVAGNFDVSRTAIYKHVKILTECGLIVVRQQGRERYYEAQLEKLHEISDWLGQYRQFWNARLDALEHFLNADGVKEVEDGKRVKEVGDAKRVKEVGETKRAKEVKGAKKMRKTPRSSRKH